MDQSVRILTISSARLDTLSMRKHERYSNDECLVKTVLNAYPCGDKRRRKGIKSPHRVAARESLQDRQAMYEWSRCDVTRPSIVRGLRDARRRVSIDAHVRE